MRRQQVEERYLHLYKSSLKDRLTFTRYLLIQVAHVERGLGFRQGGRGLHYLRFLDGYGAGVHILY